METSNDYQLRNAKTCTLILAEREYYNKGDSIMLKTLKLPTAEKFEASLDEAQIWASSVGYKEEDVDEIIKSVRQRKRK